MNPLLLLLFVLITFMPIQTSKPKTYDEVVKQSAPDLVILKTNVSTRVIELPGVVAECAGSGFVILRLRNIGAKPIKSFSYEVVLFFESGTLNSDTELSPLTFSFRNPDKEFPPNEVQEIKNQFTYCESAPPVKKLIRIQHIEYADGATWQRNQK